jgi:esterase/lipase superfamily enzyme
MHAANLFYRRPDLFDRMLALSGVYSADYGFDSYMDDLVYLNSPVQYLANMAGDHPYISLYNQKRSVVCVGQGAWEMVDSTRQLQSALDAKQIHTWVDYWGNDCSHDWYWWYKQVEYFVPYLL